MGTVEEAYEELTLEFEHLQSANKTLIELLEDKDKRINELEDFINRFGSEANHI